ncbi:MAG: hypothetical protein ACC726_07880, partial [Chloroflexota bacterium]
MTRLQEAPPARVEKSTRVPAALRDNGIREAAPAPGMRPEQLLHLQRQAGNAAVAQLLRPDTEEEEAQEVEAPEAELAPDREPEETETSSGPPADDGADEPDATPAGDSDASSGSTPEAPPTDTGEAPSGSASEASAFDDSGESSPPVGSLSPQPPAASALADESVVERALAAHDPTLAGEGMDSGAEEATLAPDERASDDAEPAASAPSLAGLQQQQGAALAAISLSERSVEARASALAGQVDDSVGTARRALMKAYVSSLASLAGLKIKARTDAFTAGVEAEAELRERRKRQKAAGTAARLVATITLDGRLGASRGKVDDYLASRLDSSGQRTAAQRQKLKSVRDAAIRGYAASSKPKQVRRLADKAYSRLLGQSLDATLKIRLDLRKKARDLKTEIDGVRSESLVQFTAAGLKVDKGIDRVGVDSTKGPIAGAAPFFAAGTAAQGEVDKITATAADQGMKAGLVPALAELDALQRASLAAIAPVRRSAARLFGSLRAGVKHRFGLVMSVVAGVRGRRRTEQALEAALDFGSQIVAGAGRGARSVADRVTGWTARLLEAPAQIVEKADFGPLGEGTRMLLATHIATVKKRFARALDDLEVLMASLVAKGASAMGSIAEKAGDSTLAKVGEQLGKLEAKFQPALDGLDRTATGFKPRLSKAAVALWDAWYEKAWSYLKGAIGGLLKAMWNFVKGLALVILAVVAAVIVVVVVLVVAFGMTIAAAAGAVAAAGAAILASAIVAVTLAGLAVYGVYKAAQGGYRRWKAVTDDPLSTREEIGSAGGEGVGDIAAEFIPLKLPKPLARFSQKVAKRLRKVEALPDGRQLDDFGSGPRNADGANKLDDIDEVGSRAGKADELDEVDAVGSRAGKADDVDELTPTPRAEAPTRADGPGPETTPRTGSADDVVVGPKPGDPLPDELLESHFGIPASKAQQFRDAAAQGDVKIWARPSTPHATARMAEGAIPKIESVKAKTLDELDLHLGDFDKGDLGKVGYFEPTLPPSKPTDMSDAMWTKLEARKNSRAAEYRDFKEEMDYLSLDPRTRGAKPAKMTREPGNDQIVVENGIVKQVDQNTGAKQVLTGDVDVYQVGKADGSP